MAVLPTGTIVIIVLACILVAMVAAFTVVMVIFTKKRRMLCFKEDMATPFERDPRYRYQKKRKEVRKKNEKVHKGPRYQHLPRSPKFRKHESQPLQNPLLEDDDYNQDWSNPVFDMEGAQLFDAAVSIQSWYRMIRYVCRTALY